MQWGDTLRVLAAACMFGVEIVFAIQLWRLKE
jgi:hypothetical protein